MAWVALAIAIVLFSVSVSLAQSTTIVREGKQVTFKYSSREGKNKVNIDTTFVAETDEDFESAMKQITERYGIDDFQQPRNIMVQADTDDRDEHFSYKMRVQPKISRKELKEMNEEIRKAMNEVHKSLRQVDESLKDINIKIYTDSDGSDDNFNFEFSMPPMPPMPPLTPQANGMSITIDTDADGNFKCHRLFQSDEADSLDDEKHVIVFGGKDEEPPQLEKTIVKKNGKKIFIYKRSGGKDEDDTKSESKNHLENLECYPNPSNGQVTLSFNAKERGDIKIQIVDASGKEIYKINMKDYSGDYSNTFNLGNKGNYIIKINHDGENYVRKVVVE